jgi:hypothetical protein
MIIIHHGDRKDRPLVSAEGVILRIVVSLIEHLRVL